MQLCRPFFKNRTTSTPHDRAATFQILHKSNLVMNHTKKDSDADSHLNLTDLPNDLFLLVIGHLSSRDAIICRCVSRRWHAVFTSENVSWILLEWHFPRSREFRHTSVFPQHPDLPLVFARVARRYHYLRAAKPRLIEKIEVVQEAEQNDLFRGVKPWDRMLRINDNTATFQYRDPAWCLDDGLLVYVHVSGHYVAYDLETRQQFKIPFGCLGRTVRRLRLASGVLVIEWCEREPYHQLDDQETVHRHFATAFDVQRCSSRPSSGLRQSSTVPSLSDHCAWTVAFRSEWKIHFLGLPISRHDRLFSAHSSTHYAVYLWQPNWSPWGEDDPLEQLTVWDVSSPSAYRPSMDPTGAHKPDADDLGPVVIQHLTWRDLDFLALRQRHTPSIRSLLLDEGNVYIHEEEHRWLAGPHSSLSPPRHHHVRCTGIPFVGFFPRWFNECCADGDVHMPFCPRSGRSGSAARLSRSSESAVNGRGSWPGLAPCWRHEEFPYLTVCEMVDSAAGVRIVARQCLMMEALSVFVSPRISIEDEGLDDETAEVRFADEMWGQLIGRGIIDGDERWIVGEDVEGRVTVVRF